MENIILNVKGMSCAHCEKAVKDGLVELGASDVSASSKDGVVKISFDPEKLSLKNIKDEIVDMGYEVV